MDTSETYIKMSDCPEIQKLSPITYYGLIVGKDNLYTSEKGDFCWIIKSSTELIDKQIWLPRQDQLQEMVIDGRDTTLLSYLFGQWVSDTMLHIPFHECTMEQLWLAFVMKELHNKVWNNEEWIAA